MRTHVYSLSPFPSPSSPPPFSPSPPPITVEHLNVSTLQEIFNIIGIHTLDQNVEIPPSQLRTIIMEVYTTLRTLKPILGTSKLKQAQELCFNWLQMAYECADGGTIDSGSLKLTLCMFVGGKPADKSRCKMLVLLTRVCVLFTSCYHSSRFMYPHYTGLLTYHSVCVCVYLP